MHRHIIFFVICFGQISCFTQKLKKRHSHEAIKKGADDSEKAACFNIRSGTMLEETPMELQNTYSSVGMLTMNFEDGNSGYCTAELIAPNAVITALHCVTDQDKKVLPPSRLTFDLKDGSGVSEAVKVIVWDEQPGHDVALVQIHRHYSESYPLYHVVGKSSFLPKEEVRMVGYGGYTSEQNPSELFAGDKRTGVAHVGSHSADQIEVTPEGPFGPIVCKGDSGSGLYKIMGAQPFLMGIASFVRLRDPSTPAAFCTSVTSAVFASSAAVAGWVRQTLPRLGSYQMTDASIIYGKIDLVTQAGDEKILQLREVKVIDNQHQVTTVSVLQVSLCDQERCGSAAALITGNLELEAEVIVHLKNRGTQLYAAQIYPAHLPYSRLADLAGTVANIGPVISSDLQSYRLLTLKDVAQTALPSQGGLVQVKLCEQGCRNIAKLPSAPLTIDQKVSLSSMIINNRDIYAREFAFSATEEKQKKDQCQ